MIARLRPEAPRDDSAALAVEARLTTPAWPRASATSFAVPPARFGASGAFTRGSSSFTISSLPESAAACSTPLPARSRTSGSAPASSNSRAVVGVSGERRPLQDGFALVVARARVGAGLDEQVGERGILVQRGQVQRRLAGGRARAQVRARLDQRPRQLLHAALDRAMQRRFARRIARVDIDLAAADQALGEEFLALVDRLECPQARTPAKTRSQALSIMYQKSAMPWSAAIMRIDRYVPSAKAAT